MPSVTSIPASSHQAAGGSCSVGSSLYALVDGNNFYVSCERVFRPNLNEVPVVVLSNNDGCAIARSNEAKEIGIRMGAPWFQIQHLQESHGLVALSANFALYGDLSDRMMSLVAGLGHRQEIYSIDESFVELSGISGDLVARAHAIRSRVLRWVGIPTCVGMGPTKTLAKLANHIAKTAESKPGSYPEAMARVCNLAALSAKELRTVLEATEVDEVWGVGPRIGQQLVDQGIRKVWDLRQLDPAAVRQRWSLVLEKTVRELQGTPCIDLDDHPTAKQQIACTRSFGQPITRAVDLEEAVSEFASRAAAKLRRQQGQSAQVMVFIRTSPFRQTPQYSRSLVVPLRRPSADTAEIAKAALSGLHRIYRTGFQYAKAGVMLLDIQPASVVQGELALGEPGLAACSFTHPSRPRALLMDAMDGLNGRYGKGTVLLGSTGITGAQRRFVMRQERKTPEYTTRWEDMPVVRA